MQRTSIPCQLPRSSSDHAHRDELPSSCRASEQRVQAQGSALASGPYPKQMWRFGFGAVFGQVWFMLNIQSKPSSALTFSGKSSSGRGRSCDGRDSDADGSSGATDGDDHDGCNHQSRRFFCHCFSKPHTCCRLGIRLPSK